MPSSPANPLPIFRSEGQRKLLVHIFVVGTEGPWSLSHLSQLVRVPISTVHREIQILDRAGIVISQRIGSARLVIANVDSPFFPDLQSLLTKAFGPAKLIATELRAVPGIDQALIFGSWARRYSGEPGPPPRDIDLLVVGRPSVQAVYRIARKVERALGLEVNPVVVSRDDLQKPKGLVKRILSGATVELDLRSRG